MTSFDSASSLVDSAEQRLGDLEVFMANARAPFPEKVLQPFSTGQPLTIERYLQILDSLDG